MQRDRNYAISQKTLPQNEISSFLWMLKARSPFQTCEITSTVTHHNNGPESVRLHTAITVSGQNTIGIYITLLVLIQPIDVEQNAVNNNWLLKLQPAVTLQSW